MNNIFCVAVNQLEEFSIIGGDPEVLQFFYTYGTGDVLDLSSATAKWRLSYLGQPDYIIVEKQAEISGNSIIVKLETEDTASLSGKFIHQPVIVDYSGNEYVYQQGIITIIPKIQNF